VKLNNERGPLLDMHLELRGFDVSAPDRVPFRASAILFAGAILEIAKALSRIAAEMERRSS
jgi:hypothetical protein